MRLGHAITISTLSEEKVMMKAAVVVPKAKAQATRKILERNGFWDKTRKLQRCEGDKVAIPVNTTDSSCLALLPWNEKGDIYVVELDLPLSKKERLITPAQQLKQAISHLLEERGVSSADKDTLLAEVPDHWEKHGDLILLPASAFLSPLWSATGQDLWQTVADCLGSRRVARQSVVHTDGFRTPQVELLLGDSGLVQHSDNGIWYEYDVTKCMFSAGNITEKLRVAGFSCQGETVVDLYAGIGYFTLPYLVHAGAEHVHACEWNPDAVTALQRNLQLNGVEHRCTVHPGDNRQLILSRVADRVNLGLIPSSEEGWPVACRVLKSTGGIMHVHGNVNSRSGSGETLQSHHHQKENRSADAFQCALNPPSPIPPSTQQSGGWYETERVKEEMGQSATRVTNNSVSLYNSTLYQSDSETFTVSDSPSIARSSGGFKETSSAKSDKSLTKSMAWKQWGKCVCDSLQNLLEKEHGGAWKTQVIHIEHVKSYAPHVDHIVLDVKCSPCPAEEKEC